MTLEESLHIHTHNIYSTYCTVGNFSREKTHKFQGFSWGYLRNLGEWRPLTAQVSNPWKFSPRKSYFSLFHKSFLSQQFLAMVAHVTCISQYGNLFLALATRNWSWKSPCQHKQLIFTSWSEKVHSGVTRTFKITITNYHTWWWGQWKGRNPPSFPNQLAHTLYL